MAWQRVGLLLQPPGHDAWCRTHAALPIVDGEWLYFTSRDDAGCGHIGRARVALADARVGDIDTRPVLSPGSLGAFDDSGVTGSCVVHAGDGTVRLFYTGWALGRTVPFYLQAGVAVSHDGGQTFARVSEAPLLDRTAVDPYLTASPWVLIEDGLWRMWYVSAAGWSRLADGTPQHRYHIRYADSDDGWHWRRGGRVAIDFQNADEYAFGRPCVVRDGDRYRMWYCVRGERYRLGYAESPDGLEWQRMDERAGLIAEPAGWERGETAYPAVADANGARWLLYNGADYGGTGIGLARWSATP